MSRRPDVLREPARDCVATDLFVEIPKHVRKGYKAHAHRTRTGIQDARLHSLLLSWYITRTVNTRDELAVIVERLSSIQQAIQDQTKALGGDRNRQCERANEPIRVNGIFRLPEDLETQRADEHQRQHTTQKVIALAAWAAFVAALAYAVIANLQLR